MYSAEDIFLDFKNFVQEKNPIIILGGHSRGAAVANIFTVLVNLMMKKSITKIDMVESLKTKD